jgi:menaquinone-9 beta-reductase
MTCALFLSRAGKKVFLIEKEQFPRDKVCADNKSWKCIDIIKELGLWKEFEKLEKRKIEGVLTVSPNGTEMYSPLLKKDVAEKGTWYNVRRILFDNLLANACKEEKNITFRENCIVHKPLFDGKQMVGIEFENEHQQMETVQGKVVVAADGSKSPIATSVGRNPEVPGRYALNARAYFENVVGVQNRCELYYLKGICPGYFWIFPVDKKTCNVGIGMRPEDLKKQGISLQEKITELLETKFRDRFTNAKQVSPFKEWGVSVLGSNRKWTGPGWVLIGDAGTFAMTFSGEGVGPGMRSGKIAAETIVQSLNENDVSARSLKRFDTRMGGIASKEMAGFKWLEFLICHERIFDWVVKRSSSNAELIKISSRMMRDYSVAKEMVSLKTLFRMLTGR